MTFWASQGTTKIVIWEIILRDPLGVMRVLVPLLEFKRGCDAVAERKSVLDALRNALRSRGFLPIVFDFERPKGLDFTETIMTLAGMSCFVIADITNPKSAPLELQATVPD
jgi:hypothetical protein